jgi:hypothetical protein
MLRHIKTHPKPLRRDGPPELTALDKAIADRHGSSIAIEATRERIEATKAMPTPSLSKIIEQRTWENGQLRQELAHHQRKYGASLYLLEEVKRAVDSLQQALINFQRLNTELGDERTDYVPEIPAKHAR